MPRRLLPLLMLACGPADSKSPRPSDFYDTVDSGAEIDEPDVDSDSDGVFAPSDCNDSDASVHPGADEIPYDGIDQDCDGTDLDDLDGDGFALVDDCNDEDEGVYPGAQERCDGVDQDCDGVVDEEAIDTQTGFLDSDGDGYGDPTAPWSDCEPLGPADGTDCDDTSAAVHPGADETCHNLVDDNCDGYTDEMVAGRTQETIQLAIEAACYDGDTVWVPAGTYSENLRIARPIVVRGISGAPTTVVDGSACTADDCPVVLVEADEIEIRGLTVTGGFRPLESGFNGGGVAADNHKDVVVSRCRVTGNRAYRGGGISLWGGRVEATEIDANEALDYGGGIFLDSVHAGDVSVDRSHIHDNVAGYGGGAFQYARNGVEWTNNTVEFNTAVLGGGIFLDGYTPTSYGNLISGNTATAAIRPGDCSGGGLLDAGLNWDASRDTVSGNHPDNICGPL